ncbi:MAG: F0F1 ATP synthase subunit A [Armatimonadetes bacterium]|nr:F0F1 ATP synthase subunit A [Armatimonadota bacterium]
MDHGTVEHGAAAGHGAAGASVIEGSPWVYVVMSLLVALLLTFLAWRATRRMERVPRGLQNAMEFIVESLFAFVRGIIGPGGEKYAPLVATFFLYIFCMNVLGLLPPPFKSPTANPTITIGLALVAFVMVQVYSIQASGVKGYFKHFIGDPWWLGPLMFPLHVVGELARPLSLSIRLFGNIFGEDMVIAQLTLLAALTLPKFIPIPFQLPMMLFGIFTAFVQALVFSMLVSIYIAVGVTHDDHEEHGAHPQEAHSH